MNNRHRAIEREKTRQIWLVRRRARHFARLARSNPSLVRDIMARTEANMIGEGLKLELGPYMDLCLKDGELVVLGDIGFTPGRRLGNPVLGMITPKPLLTRHFPISHAAAHITHAELVNTEPKLYISSSKAEAEKFNKRIESMILDDRTELNDFKRLRLGIPFHEQEDNNISAIDQINDIAKERGMIVSSLPDGSLKFTKAKKEDKEDHAE